MPVFDPGGTITPTTYVTVAEVKAALGHIADSIDDGDMNRAVVAASRAIDTYAGRPFYKTTSAAARSFRACNMFALLVPDIASAVGLVVATDENFDGTFETTWAASDYQLEPFDSLSLPVPRPYTEIVAVNRYFPHDWRGRPGVRVTAVWGWPEVPADITQAALTLTIRLFKRKDAWAGVTGSAEMGVARISSLLRDPDVTALVDPFRIPAFA